MKICPKCGAQVEDNVKFCACGMWMQDVEVAAPVKAEPVQAAPEAPKDEKAAEAAPEQKPARRGLAALFSRKK